MIYGCDENSDLMQIFECSIRCEDARYFEIADIPASRRKIIAARDLSMSNDTATVSKS